MRREVRTTIHTSNDGQRCSKGCQHLSADEQQCLLFGRPVSTPRRELLVRCAACLKAEAGL